MYAFAIIVVIGTVWLHEVMGIAGVVFSAPAIGVAASMLILGERK